MANHLLDAMPSTTYKPGPRNTASRAGSYGGVGGVFLLWVAFGALILFWPDTLASLWSGSSTGI